MENKKQDNALEFNFESPEEGGLVFERTEHEGLVFEAEKKAEVKPEPVQNTEKPKETVPDKPKETVPDKPKETVPEKPKERTEEKKCEEEPDNSSEFALPDIFEVNEKYNTPIRKDERTRIYTTYVPRFTEASENYRMKNDPRPRPKTEEPPAPKVVAEEKSGAEAATKAPSVTAEETEPQPEPPKAEEPPKETVVVNVRAEGRDSLDGESYNIFKFNNHDPDDRDRLKTDEENANRRALEELKAKQAERRAREEAERLEREAAEREAARARARVKLSPDDYTIPDPEYSSYTDKRTRSDADYDTPHGIPGDTELPKKRRPTEYARAGQRDGFKDRFLDSLVSLRIRIIAAVLLSVSLLFLENTELFGIDLTRYFGRISGGAVAIVDLQIVLCAVLLALPEIIRAVRALFRREVLPELSLVWSLIVLSVYTAIKVTFEYVGAPDFGFILSVSVVLALIASFMKRKADFECFKFVAVEGEKKILEHEETRRYPRMTLALDGAVDGYKSNTARSFRTTFVTDFFKTSAKRAESTRSNLIILAISLGVALVTAVVTYFASDSSAIENATAGFALTAVLTVPAFTLLSHKLTYRHAGKEAMSANSAVIGEAAYEDCAAADVIAFEDTEIFGEDDVNLKRFGFYGNEENMNRCMRLMSSLFASVGGPLSIIFAKTLEKRCTPASDPEVEQDGISAKVDGRTVSAGSAEYMNRHGIRIPEDNDRAYGIGAESMKTMYGAENGVVFAKFFIRYSFSEEFTSLLPAMRDEHIVPLIYTSDPNVSNELLRTLTMGADSVRVMRRTEPGRASDRVYPRLYANAVTVGEPISAIRLILISKKYNRFVRSMAKAEIITASVLAACAALVSVLGVAAAVPTAALGLVGLIPAFVLSAVSKRKFNLGKNNKGK